MLGGLATTRAVRRLRPDPIPEADLATILWHATRAPSGSNRQPARFLVLRAGPAATEAKALLGRAFRAGWAEKAGAEGRHGPVRRRPLAEVVFDDPWDQPASWAADPPGTRFAGGPPRST